MTRFNHIVRLYLEHPATGGSHPAHVIEMILTLAMFSCNCARKSDMPFTLPRLTPSRVPGKSDILRSAE